jgi:hypothetical protein
VEQIERQIMRIKEAEIAAKAALREAKNTVVELKEEERRRRDESKLK